MYHLLLFILIGITYLFNNISMYYGFFNLTYKLKIPRKIYEIGEEIEITSIVENRKPLTVSFLEVQESYPLHLGNETNTYTLFIMPHQRVSRTYKVSAKRRGRHVFEDVRLKLGDFIGFRTELDFLKIHQEVTVLPARASLAHSLVPIGAMTGDISVQRWIVDDPLMTIGIREYTGTEPQRYIHWPSSLRYGELMVKKFDFTTDNSAMVILNMETMKPCWKPVEEDLIEEAISITRAVLEDFEDLKVPYGLATNAYNDSQERRGYMFHPGLGKPHLNAFLETLGQLHYRIPGFFELTLRDIQRLQGNYTTVVIITPRILESYIEPINLLSRSVSRTVVVSLEGEHLEALNNGIIKYRGRER